MHLVWATWDRLPLITPGMEQPLYNAMAAKCEEMHCQPLAIGGMPDHVHVLVSIPTTISIAEVVKGIKGSTSHLMTHVVAPDVPFKWQGLYGAFTVSKSGVERVMVYIRAQKAHHAEQTLIGDLECCAGEATSA